MARKAQLINEEQFKNLAVNYAINNLDNFDGLLDSDDLKSAKNGNVYKLIGKICMDEMLGKAVKDWSKINYDMENLYCDPAESKEWQVGFQTLDNGFTYVGIMAGGDWEFPVYSILYHDGKEFRGYIPTKGNSYNPVSKTAFGSEDDDDMVVQGFIKLGITVTDPKDSREATKQLMPKFDEIRKDISERIEISGTYSKPLKKIDFDFHIAQLELKEQEEMAEFQKKQEEYVKNYRNEHVVYTADGKSEYTETVTVYEYKHMVTAAKTMLDAGMSFADFVALADSSEDVETLVVNVTKAIYQKNVKEAARRLFGDDDDE